MKKLEKEISGKQNHNKKGYYFLLSLGDPSLN